MTNIIEVRMDGKWRGKDDHQQKTHQPCIMASKIPENKQVTLQEGGVETKNPPHLRLPPGRDSEFQTGIVVRNGRSILW
jgi:hypothetical protein